MATQAEIARHLDLSQGAVSSFLGEEGILRGSGGYDLEAVRIAYIRRLREKAAGRGGDDGKLNLAEERAKLAVLQTEAWEIKNQKSLGLLLPRSDVTAAVQTANARVRARLLAIPPRAAPLIAAISAPTEVQAKLSELVHEALAELASVQVVTGSADDGESPGGGGGGPRMDDGVRTAAQADGQRVGRRKPGAELRRKRRAGKVVDSPG